MKSISIFIVLFILLSAGTCLFANHSYYCDCVPPPFGECQCNTTNGQPATEVGLGPWATTHLWINCTGYHAIVPTSGVHADGPSVWKTSNSIGCALWEHPSIVVTKNAYRSCTNRSFLHTYHLNIKYIKCANYYG